MRFWLDDYDQRLRMGFFVSYISLFSLRSLCIRCQSRFEKQKHTSKQVISINDTNLQLMQNREWQCDKILSLRYQTEVHSTEQNETDWRTVLFPFRNWWTKIACYTAEKFPFVMSFDFSTLCACRMFDLIFSIWNGKNKKKRGNSRIGSVVRRCKRRFCIVL